MSQRRPRKHDEKHLAFIRQLPSLIRSPGDIDVAHVRFADALFAKPITGMAEKPSDCWTVPLAHSVHMSQHDAGDERTWWRKRGINPLIIASLLYVHSGDLEAGATIIRNARSIAPW